ncbi:alcohol dehydrogenase [Hyaloraphidium curvatum]|nr:alcohol dehydrogenase [Hyaloraphidium curvatum]
MAVQSNNAALLAELTSSIPETMLAAVNVKHKSPLQLQTVPVPKVKDDEVLVKIVASGICHSDLHIADGEMPAMMRPNLIVGHEGVGIVVKAGAQAARSGIRVGDRVAVGNINSACQHCVECHEGREQHCKEYIQTGGAVNGCYAEYATIHYQFAVKLPDGLPFALAAPVACAGHTVYSAVRQLGARPGTWCAVIGVGGLGHLAIQYLISLGYRVIAIDVSKPKLELAKKLGAAESFDASDPKLVSNVMRYTGGGCSGCVVTAVHESAFLTSIRITRIGGGVLWISLPNKDITISPKVVAFKAVRIQGSVIGNRAEMAEAYRMVAGGKVTPIVEVVPFEKVNEAWDRLRSGNFEARIVMEVDPKLMDVTTSLAAGAPKI